MALWWRSSSSAIRRIMCSHTPIMAYCPVRLSYGSLQLVSRLRPCGSAGGFVGQPYEAVVHRAILLAITITRHSLACIGVQSLWSICCTLPVIRATIETLMLRSFMKKVVRPPNVVRACLGMYLGRCGHVDSDHSACPCLTFAWQSLVWGVMSCPSWCGLRDT